MRTETPTWTWEEVSGSDHLNARERQALTGLLDGLLEMNAGTVTSTATTHDGQLVFSATVAVIDDTPIAFVMRGDEHETIVVRGVR